jgi:hypothetical protein
VRSRECCECCDCSDDVVDHLISVNNWHEATLRDLLCDPETACPPCEPTYSASITASCQHGVCDLRNTPGSEEP